MDQKYRNQWRNQRNLSPPFGTIQYSLSNYTTDSKSKTEMTFADEMLIHNLHLMPNPLQKNLADTIVTAEEKPKMKSFKENPELPPPASHYYPSFTGIGSFISGVLSVLSGGMFQRRKPAYHECCDEGDWQPAKREVLNKSQTQSVGQAGVMSDCRSAAAHCEDKLNRVRLLLNTKPATPTKLRRRPRKVFVEPGSVEETFEDAFSEEDFEQFGSEPHIHCFSPASNHREQLIEAEAPKMKIETPKVAKESPQIPPEIKPEAPTEPKMQIETTKVTKESSQIPTETKNIEVPTKMDIDEVDAVCKNIEVLKIDPKVEVIASCEDKVSKLKALLQFRSPKRSRPNAKADSDIEPVLAKPDDRASNRATYVRIGKPQDKHHKTPNGDKKKKSQILKNIHDDMSFGSEIETEDVSSPDSSPLIKPTKLCDMINICPKLKEETKIPKCSKEYFDEISGRFRSTSTTDSEDSFQIVFTDSPQDSRHRGISDCESEDSFIVFEDSPDSCYTSHDVFGDSEVSEDDSDSESNISDSGCGLSKLTSSMSRTVGDLTDDSLFEDTVRADSDSDELDSVTVCEELPTEIEVKVNTGLLMNDSKKLLRRQQPPKKVQFSSEPPKVHVMRVWAFAARQARAGHWEQHALDRDRFKRKIADVDMAVSWVLKPQHRSRVMFQRFMPWWNAQRRLEIAEKKRKEAEILKEEERVKEGERLKEEDIIKEEIIKEEESVKEEGISKGVSNGEVDQQKFNEVKISSGEVLSETVEVLNDVDVVKDVKILSKCDFYGKPDTITNRNTKVVVES